MLLTVQQHGLLDSPWFRASSNDTTSDTSSARSSTEKMIEIGKTNTDADNENRPLEPAISMFPSTCSVRCNEVECNRRCGITDKVTFDIEDLPKLGTCEPQRCAMKGEPQPPSREGSQEMLDGLRDLPLYLSGIMNENSSQCPGWNENRSKCAGCHHQSSCKSQGAYIASNNRFRNAPKSTFLTLDDGNSVGRKLPE
mmetsp:Transcript_112483/g.223538  ORF Transcript_112483/g.223538 Transcript_112483/m.223538 type:complete len:197 (+) Transcript_112483:130-720(+)